MLKSLNIFRISLFFLIIWPTYIALKVGSLPALSLDRIMVLILFIMFFIHMSFKSKKIKNLYHYNDLSKLLLIYFCWNIVSSVVGSENVSSSIAATINWFLLGPFLLFIVIVFVNTKKQILQIITTILFTMFLVNLIGLVEVYKEELLFKNYLITVNEYTLSAMTEKVRGDSYRIRSVFTNPLVYSQYLLLVLPLQVYYYKQKKSYILKFILVLNILLSLYLIYKTGSRAGLALSLAIPILSYYIFMYTKKWFKYFSALLLTIVLVMSVVQINDYLDKNMEIINNLHNLNVQGEVDQETISTFARVLQFERGYESILIHPVFGIGFGEALKAVDPLESIDNYYLTLILSTGSVGFLLFLLLLYKSINKGIKNIRLYQDELTLYLLLSIVLILIYYFILSIPKANSLLFIMIGLLYVQSRLLEKEYSE